ncbi:OmpW family protein [Permianibacter sp. IMCC34836]|uniref:OmpW/AlkL family protein n=1 Tax=Permianibacter fluminis TaxID=2738515 RepID=UPI001556FBC6|nr:OmpW family outer membrane protein [Permianibacter fluminis]NQD38947.1 OmpW family protein [Permianibacter fluminis]
MRSRLSAVAVSLGLIVALNSSVVLAEESPWLFRFRALNLDMDSQSSGEVLPADAISVSDKVIPDFNISYFFTPNWAAELVLTIPQEHDVKVEGLGNIGSFKHLPPTLTLAYHFSPDSNFRPYVGAGINYTLFMDEDMQVGNAEVTLENDSIGAAYRVGFDWVINKDWLLNVDVKKILIGSDVYLDGTKISSLDVDPLAIGVGIGWYF